MGCAASNEAQVQQTTAKHGHYPAQAPPPRQVFIHQQAPSRQQTLAFQQAPPSQQVPPFQPGLPPPPPLQKSSAPTAEEDDIEPEPVEINEELVQLLVDMDKEISQLESRNVTKQYKLKSDQMARLAAQVETMIQQQQTLVQNTHKEHRDVKNLQSTKQLMMQDQYNNQMSKEQEEYVQALSKQEVHKKELNNTNQQLETCRKQTESLKKDADRIQELYDKQDRILSSIFDGKYGSEREYNLESELDIALERKQRVGVAKYKWQNAQVLLQHAGGQLGFAIRRWGDVMQIPPQNTDIRYQFAAECRNNLVAALQNITSSQQYLNTIRFPYCTPDEMKTLDTAIDHIFTDILTPERHRHAMECYVTVYRRNAALIQWCDHVIKKTILGDLETATRDCATKKQELKQERLQLIKEKIREKLGGSAADRIQISDASEMTDNIDQDESELLMLVEADAVSQAGDLGGLAPGGNNTRAVTPLPMNELAPTPSMDDLFGNIDELKRQHEDNVRELQRQQEMAKARVDQDLQSKLAKRRSRRRRVQQQETEMQSLADKS